MMLTVMLSCSFLFLVVASLGVVDFKIDRSDEDEAIAEGGFKRAARWILVCSMPGFILYMIDTFIPNILNVPLLLLLVLINGGFVLGFVFFYIAEKRLRDRRRRNTKQVK